MSWNLVSKFKLLMSNFCSSHFNYISFSVRVEFYRPVKGFNDSISIRMQRHKHSLHILQNAVNLTDKFIINLRSIFRAEGLPREKGTWGGLCSLSCWGGQQSCFLERVPPAAAEELLLHFLCNKCICSPLSSCLCHHAGTLPAVLIHQLRDLRSCNNMCLYRLPVPPGPAINFQVVEFSFNVL